MATQREPTLLALFAALQTADGLTVTRNTPLPELASGGTVCRLGDGTIEPGDVFINPRQYEFTMTPLVLIVVAGGADDAARDAAVETAIQSLLAVIATADLGEQVTDIRPQPPTFAPRELWGAANMKGAEFGIEIDYWSDSSAG